MADALKFESPVVRRPPRRSDPAGRLVLSDESAAVKWLIRAAPDGDAARRLAVEFGSSHATEDGALVLGSRPGEWIVTGDAPAVAAVVASLDGLGDADFVTALEWTHGRAMFRLSGPDAPNALEKVCSLDFSDEMTPDGAVVSAQVAKVVCDIARRDVASARGYLVFCDRSLGQYLFDALIDAGEEFRVSVAA